MALTNKQAYDITNMNVAAQKANLGQLINDIIEQSGVALDDDTVAKLNNMNVAFQNVQAGTLLNSIIDGSVTA